MKRTGGAFIVLHEGHNLCYKGLADRKEHGVGLLIKKNLAGNVEAFFCISKWVVGINI